MVRFHRGVAIRICTPLAQTFRRQVKGNMETKLSDAATIL